MTLDLTNRKFGFLTAVERSGSRETAAGARSALWRCRCDCGCEIEVVSRSLVEGKRKSCGSEVHRRGLVRSLPRFIHAQTWGCYVAMIARCRYPTNRGWRNYGGRGIRVCEEWLEFEAFLKDMGPRPSPEHTIERLDVNGNYEPGNCVWATMAEQALNRRNTVFVEWRGERRKLVELCKELGVDCGRTRSRLNMGWSLEKALSQEPSMAVRIRELLKKGVSVATVMAMTGASRSAVDVAKHRLK